MVAEVDLGTVVVAAEVDLGAVAEVDMGTVAAEVEVVEALAGSNVM